MAFFRHVRALPWSAVAFPGAALLLLLWANGNVGAFEELLRGSSLTKPIVPLLGALFKSGFWLVWAWLINGAVRVFVWDGLARHFGREAVPRFFRHTVTTVIFLAALGGIANYVFEQAMTGIWATSGALGLVLGFALKSLIADFFSGVALSLDPPFHLGDWIMVRLPGEDPIYGQVVEMHWRLTRIQNRGRSRTVSVPHSMLASASVTNYYKPGGFVRVEAMLWLDQVHGIERLTRILESAVIGLPDILETPRPQVLLHDTNEAGIVFNVRFFVGPAVSIEVAKSCVLAAALTRLEQSGISTANYKRDVAVSRRRESAAWNVAQGIDELILRTPIFATLDRGEAAELASHTKVVEVRGGQTVIQAGETGESMYILREGALEVLITDAKGEKIRARHLRPGDFFGEMSLLTGDVRSATVAASTDAILCEIGKAALEPILRRNPQIADEICRVVAERRSENTGILEGQSAANEDDRASWLTRQLLTRMKRFFGL